MKTLFVVLLGTAAVCALAKDAEYVSPEMPRILSTELSGSDLVFFAGAARQTALLVRLSEMAKGRAATPEVQALAAAAWKEQTDAAARLKDLAGRKEVPLPEEPDGPAKDLVQALAILQGFKFDKSCLDALADAQDQLGTALEAGAASTDRDIKAFAAAEAGTLKVERERVRKLGL